MLSNIQQNMHCGAMTFYVYLMVKIVSLHIIELLLPFLIQEQIVLQ